MPTLENCPFCGSKAKMRSDRKDARGKRQVEIWCKGCPAKMEAYTASIRDSDMDRLREWAIKKWNRRVNV